LGIAQPPARAESEEVVAEERPLTSGEMGKKINELTLLWQEHNRLGNAAFDVSHCSVITVLCDNLTFTFGSENSESKDRDTFVFIQDLLLEKVRREKKAVEQQVCEKAGWKGESS
jgi:hypothetical protein